MFKIVYSRNRGAQNNLFASIDMSKDEDKGFVLNKRSEAPSSKPQQHRCNGHLEDLLEGLTKWPMDVSKPFNVFLECLKSQPGKH